MHYLRVLPGAGAASRLVPLVVGVLVIGAALFKAHGALTDPSSSNIYPGGLLFQLVLIEVELFVGLALFFAIRLSVMRLATLALFAAFLVVALYQGIAGARSCACLGSVEMDPWIMASLDACVL